jgi:hypothetical protein
VDPHKQLNEACGLFQDHNKSEARIESQTLLDVFNNVWYSVTFTAIHRIYLQPQRLCNHANGTHHPRLAFYVPLLQPGLEMCIVTTQILSSYVLPYVVKSKPGFSLETDAITHMKNQ